MRLRPAPRALLLPAAVLLATSVLAGCGDDGSSAAGAGDGGSGGSGGSGAAACDYPADDAGQVAAEVEAPPADPEADADVAVVLELGQGEVPLTLDAASAPCTVGSFLSLVEQDYFDDSPCHRLTAAESPQGDLKVLQCGDPTGTGFAGPGYTFADELRGDETYPAGTVAMANAGPDTNGSQFFLVYEDSTLPPSYTVFGEMDAAGLEVVRGIAEEGVEGGGQDGAPAAGVTVADVRVEG